MPELAEVEVARAFLARRLSGRRITTVMCTPDDRVFVTPPSPDLLQSFRGQGVVDVGRHGKRCFVACESSGGILFHLGMTGYFRDAKGAVAPPLEQGHRRGPPRLRIELDDDGVIDFIDPRRFGKISLVPHDVSARAKSGLGVDLLEDEDVVNAALHNAWVGSRRTLKAILLDQGVVAGVGNWLADEALHQAELHPARRASMLSATERARLVGALRDVAFHAVAAGAEAAAFPADWIFHLRFTRADDRAVAARGLKRIQVAGRTTYVSVHLLPD